jgi:phospholipase B1
MKTSPNIDFANDWKMVTLFIGGNDLCRFCFNRAKHSPKQYIDDIQAGLDLLFKEVPRVFVNLVPIIQVAMIKDFNIGSACKALHVVECKCGIILKKIVPFFLIAK